MGCGMNQASAIRREGGGAHHRRNPKNRQLERSGQEVQRRASIPKLHVHNTALISAQQQYSFSEISANPSQWARWVESAIGAHLINHARTDAINLFYLRQGNHELDFVLEHKGKVIGLEVKSGRIEHTSGMAAFEQQCKPYKVLFVVISGIPWQEFLELEPLELFA